MSVERFEPSGGGGQGAAYYEMDKASDGEWVRFEDYEKLHKELDTLSTRFTALIQQNNTLAAENERLSDELSKAEAERDYQKLLAIDCAEQCIKSGNEIVELSEKLEAMESQEPCFYARDGLTGAVSIHTLEAGSPEAKAMYNIPLYAKPVPADKPAVALNYKWPNLSTDDVIELAPMEGHFSEWEQECYAGGFRRCAAMLVAENPTVAVPDKLDSELDHKYYDDCYINGWNACIDAILSAAQSHSQQSANTAEAMLVSA